MEKRRVPVNPRLPSRRSGGYGFGMTDRKEREERLAEALRANLRLRKAQARAQAERAVPDPAPPRDPEPGSA